MARKVLFTAERFRKKMQELRKGGFVLRQDSVICGGDLVFSREDVETLRNLGVAEEWLCHAISEIRLYFYTKSSVKRISVVAGASGVAKIVVDDLDFSKELVSEDVGYVITLDDRGDEGSERYLVLGSDPIFRELMVGTGLLPESTVLWNIFNAYLGEGYSVGVISGISQECLEEILENLLNMGFVEANNGAYVSESGNYWVAVELEACIRVLYRDVYMGIPIADFRIELAEELGISDFATRYYNEWAYRLRLVDGDVNDSVFKFDRLNLEDLLTKLHLDNYTLDSVGIVNVRSWANSKTVCGFRNGHDYVYILFYFDEDRKDFLVEIVSSKEEVVSLQINDTVIPLVHVSVGGFREVSTFIRGFNFSDFRRHAVI